MFVYPSVFLYTYLNVESRSPIRGTWPLSLPFFLRFQLVNVSSDNCFLWIPACFHTWSVNLAYFLKTFYVVNNFQQWVLELSYCRIWPFPVTRSLYWYPDIFPCDLDHLWIGYYLRGEGVFHKVQHISLFFFLSFSLYYSLF